MKILLHTIALEPARWTSQRVSFSLAELLPRIAETDFTEVEVFEPHLTAETASAEIKEAFSASNLTPVILSSYLNLRRDVTSDDELDRKLGEMAARVDFYGFQKVRLFPGPGVKPDDDAGVRDFKERVQLVLERVPKVEVLLETHDGSLADDPRVIAGIVNELAHPRLALLFQATFFQEPESIREQFRIEKPFMRHLHLQNRMPDGAFVRMEEGIVPWPEILRDLGEGVDATLEFVPVGICSPEEFDLEACLKQACAEADYVRSLLN